MSAANVALAVLALVIAFAVVDLDDFTLSKEQPIQFVEPFQYNALGNDRSNLNGEMVNLENQGDETIDFSGWTLESDAGEIYVFADGFALEPGARVTIHSGCGDDTKTDLYWCSRDPIWDDKRGIATLRTRDYEWVTVYSYDLVCTTCEIKRRD